MQNKDNFITRFLKGNKFGTILLILCTALEAFFAYTLFSSTGTWTFRDLTIPVSVIYSSLIAGVIVYFTLNSNNFIVWCAVIYELTTNFMLDVHSILHSHDKIDYRVEIFITQVLIGSLLPLATKAFAESLKTKEPEHIDLDDTTQVELAKKIGVSQSTVSRAKKKLIKTE